MIFTFYLIIYIIYPVISFQFISRHHHQHTLFQFIRRPNFSSIIGIHHPPSAEQNKFCYLNLYLLIIPTPPTRILYIISIIVTPPSSLFQFIINFPKSRPCFSSLYIPPLADQIRLHIVKRRTYYYQLDRHPLSEDPLSVPLLLSPISRHYSSLSAALYNLLSCHQLSSGDIPVHWKFPHRQTLLQFIIHSPISRTD